MLGSLLEPRCDFKREFEEILGAGYSPDELRAANLSSEDVNYLSELNGLIPEELTNYDEARTMVTRDVYLDCYANEVNPNGRANPPDRSGVLLTWDHSPERGSTTPKRKKKIKTGGWGSSCSSPAMSDTSDDGISPLDVLEDFAVTAPISGLLEDLTASTLLGGDFLEEISWMAENPLFPLSAPPSPTDGSLPWEGSSDTKMRDSEQASFHSCSVSSSLWNSTKKWSHLRQEEKREALSGLINILGELGIRERLDINHILNVKSSGGPVVIGLNTINNEKWKQLKDYMKKLMSFKSGKETPLMSFKSGKESPLMPFNRGKETPLMPFNRGKESPLMPFKNVKESSKSRSNCNSQMRSWQPSDHPYAPMSRSTVPESAPMKRLFPPESCSVTVSPAAPSPPLPVINSKAQSRLSADPLVSSGASASRDSSSSGYRRPTSNVLSNPPKSHSSVPSKKDFPKDKRNIIKARRKGVNRKYQPSKNSILKKDVIQKITQNANRVTKKGLRMQVDEKDVEKALSGCFDQEEIIVLGKTSVINVDEYIDVLA